MLKNKKGNVPVVILVLLVFVMAFATIFSFVSNAGKLELKISDTRIVEKVYLEENLAEFYIKQAGNSVVKTGISSNVFRGDFKKEFLSYRFETDFLLDLKQLIQEDKFSVSKEKEVFIVRISELRLRGVSNNVDIDYFPKISVEIRG